MMSKRIALTTAAVALSLGATAPIVSAEGLPITPGLWEMTTQNPMTGRDHVRQECMTDAVFDPHKMMEAEQDCVIGSQSVSGNTLDYDMTCADPSGQGTMKGHFSFTVEGDQGHGNADMKVEFNGQAMNMNYSMTAARVGDC